MKSLLARLRTSQEIRYLKRKIAEADARSSELKQSSQTIVNRLHRSLDPTLVTERLELGNALNLFHSEAAYRSICSRELDLAANNIGRLAKKAFLLESEIKSKTDQSYRHREKEKACLILELTQRAQGLATLDSREQVDIEEVVAQKITADGELWAI